MRFPEHMHKADRHVISAIIRESVALGWTISVFDGMEWVIKLGTNENEISEAMGSSDADEIVIRDGTATRIGWALLIYGNKGECLADCSVGTNVEFNRIMDIALDRSDVL